MYHTISSVPACHSIIPTYQWVWGNPLRPGPPTSQVSTHSAGSQAGSTTVVFQTILKLAYECPEATEPLLHHFSHRDQQGEDDFRLQFHPIVWHWAVYHPPTSAWQPCLLKQATTISSQCCQQQFLTYMMLFFQSPGLPLTRAWKLRILAGPEQDARL